jgi:hypothetical protein
MRLTRIAHRVRRATAQQRPHLVHRQADHVRVRAADPSDERPRAALYGIGPSLVERLAAVQVAVDLLRRERPKLDVGRDQELRPVRLRAAQNDRRQHLVHAPREGTQHPTPVGAIDRFAEDGAVHNHDRVRGEHPRVRTPPRHVQRLFARHAAGEPFGRFAGCRLLGNVARHDLEHDAGLAEQVAAAR